MVEKKFAKRKLVIGVRQQKTGTNPGSNARSTTIILRGGPVMKVDVEKMIAEISLLENAVYRVVDGKIEKIDVPGVGFGKQIITWQNGKPTYYEISYTKK